MRAAQQAAEADGRVLQLRVRPRSTRTPAEALRLLGRSSQLTKPKFSPLDVCGDWVCIDYPPDEARAVIRARIGAVQEIAVPGELASTRDECLRFLREALALQLPQPLD